MERILMVVAVAREQQHWHGNQELQYTKSERILEQLHLLRRFQQQEELLLNHQTQIHLKLE